MGNPANKANSLDFRRSLKTCSLLVLAAGFESRALGFLKKAKLRKDCCIVLIHFDNEMEANLRAVEIFGEELRLKGYRNIYRVAHNPRMTSKLELDLKLALSKVRIDSGEIFVDVSGMPAQTICSTLKVVRQVHAIEHTNVIYTAAKTYIPSHREYLSQRRKQRGAVEYLPYTMALEMDRNYFPATFQGHSSNYNHTCLILFAGYEVHRSAGVIDTINPTKLLILYGEPGDTKLHWRLDLSRELHKKFENSRNSSTEIVSTLDVDKSLTTLGMYYQYLCQDHDFIIAPVCSKMQTVACYLFWESFKEIQLVFPLPIGYDPKAAPSGVGKTYRTTLAPSSWLHQMGYRSDTY